MSSYLLQFTAGELERLTTDADGVAVSVVTVRGKREQGRFALTSAIELLRYFNNYFGLKYPLPKLDLIAVPDGHVSAMEHWGAITFRERGLLLDPAGAGPARRAIFRVVAHELAHQWFGNLVTMGWWDNLWLNEGFATWMEAKATEHFHPHWQTWLDDNSQKQTAMGSDARGTAHPIQQPVADVSQASELFDNITYNKAAAVVRMLEGYVGEEAFRAGLRQYMSMHAYGNTTGADLWQALETSSGKPVEAVGAAFVNQRGVPLVIARAMCLGDEQRIALRQERFTARQPSPGPGGWQVPIIMGPPGTAAPSATIVLGEPTVIAAGRCGEPVKLNLGDVGYYRVEYDAKTRAALTQAMPLLSAADRVSMLADTWALVEAGRAPPSTYLDLVERIAESDSSAVWSQIIRTLKAVDNLQRDRPERAAFQAYARAKLRPVLDHIGWDGSDNDGDGGGMLRPMVIRFLGELGDENVLAETKRRFAAFRRDPGSLRQGLRDTMIHLAGISADRGRYDTLLTLARAAGDASSRDRYYLAAASARDPDLARQTLASILSNDVPAGLIARMISAVAWQGGQAEMAWAFLQKNFNVLAAHDGSSLHSEYVASFMRNFSDRRRAVELAGFAPAHATPGSRSAAKRAEEEIRLAADFKARTLPAIDGWIRRHAVLR
jgi:aminopeptidase N